MDHQNEEGCVKKKLNEALFKKLQELGGKRGSVEKEVSGNLASNPQQQSKSLRQRRRSSVVALDETSTIKINNTKRRNSVIQDERSVHDAYHCLLNEYERVSNFYLQTFLNITNVKYTNMLIFLVVFLIK